MASSAGTLGSLRRASKRRRGTATVELAVCLPLIVIVGLGSIEATNAIFLKERLTSAAYEGARSATTPSHTAAAATTAAQTVLTQFGVSGGTVTINPSVTTSTTVGTWVTVTVAAPLKANSGVSPFIVGKLVTNVSAKVTMIHQ
jgi:Flp pilus assembly protein TadG